MKIIVVGHGPSVLTGRGSVIDTFDAVVRLKGGPATPPHHWGTRTDYLCACSPRFDKGRVPFWLARSRPWMDGKKPTTGMCAVMEAFERLRPESVYVIGFDRLMHPDRPDPPHTWLAHDKYAEHELLMLLGVQELGQVR